MTREIERRKLEHYLPRAISRIVEAIESPNEKIAVGAARYLIDQCIGRPVAAISDNDNEAAAATALVKALQKAQEQVALQAPQEPIVEGGVRILGSPIPEPEPEGVLQTDKALTEIDDF